MTRCSISLDTSPLVRVPASRNEPTEGPLTSKVPSALKLSDTTSLLSGADSWTMRPEKVTGQPVSSGIVETSTLIFALPRSLKRWFSPTMSEHVGTDSGTSVEI